MMGKARFSFRKHGGFTLIEIMITVALLVIIIVSVAPSFKRLIETQRVRSTAAQLVTDLQFARSEAVQRNTLMRLTFQESTTETCYTIYTSSVNNDRCDCRFGAGNACPSDPTDPTKRRTELRTVSFPKNSGVKVIIPFTEFDSSFAFDNVTGGLFKIPTDDASSPLDSISMETFIDAERKLQIRLNRAGRPSICKPAGSTITETACPA